MHCDGNHFTLLRLTNIAVLPMQNEENCYEYVSHHGNLSRLLCIAKSSGLLVNNIETMQSHDACSLRQVLKKILTASVRSNSSLLSATNATEGK